jgi:hypothetical protein
MVRKINACLDEGLKEGNKWTSQTLQNEKGTAVTACCLERVRLFNNTKSPPQKLTWVRVFQAGVKH